MFERLTKKVFICGVPYFIDTVGNDIEAENMTTYQIGMALNRLAAYEDTGLSPEEVREFAKAKAEGRLVVLPCKVGTEVYKIVTLIGGETLIVEGNMTEYEINRSGEEFYFSEETRRHDIWCEAGCFGKTVFLSREAAEKAITEVGE